MTLNASPSDATSTDTPGRRLHYFKMLSHDDQRAAIRRLAASGMTDHTIAAATRLSVEMVRQILGAREL